MELLLIRHAIAEDRDTFVATGRDDALRPLTREGRRKMRDAARGLASLVPRLDLLVSSPLVRAMQTAEIVARGYGGIEVTTIPQLEPDQPTDAFVGWLGARAETGIIAAVGHEPSLGHIVSHLLAGRAEPFFEFKKGGACLVAFPARVRPGAGMLRWALTPGQLRALRD